MSVIFSAEAEGWRRSTRRMKIHLVHSYRTYRMYNNTRKKNALFRVTSPCYKVFFCLYLIFLAMVDKNSRYFNHYNQLIETFQLNSDNKYELNLHFISQMHGEHLFFSKSCACCCKALLSVSRLHSIAFMDQKRTSRIPIQF